LNIILTAPSKLIESNGPMIYHIIHSEDWAAAAEPYSPVELSRDGFVRCLYLWQVERVARERFPDSGGLLALELDYRAFLPNEVRSENLPSGGEAFPQVCSPIPRAAIRRVHELGREGNRAVRFEAAHPLFDRLSPGFRVRHALGRDEVATLALFRCRMFAELHPEQAVGMDSAVFLASTEDYYGRCASDPRRSSYLLFAGREILGCAALTVEEKPPRPGLMPNLAGHVRDVYVLPEHRGRGGARLLLTMVREEAARRGIRKLALHASEMGRPLYSSMGFKPDGSYLELEDVHGLDGVTGMSEGQARSSIGRPSPTPISIP
jgi:GNAT superfamily N-acetyltransferase/uncharacterized protein (DUF952 family)